MTRASPDRMPLTVVPELGEVGLLIRKHLVRGLSFGFVRRQ